ncbi:hypothetical protein Tco_0796157 [Tanacetum coccineum]
MCENKNRKIDLVRKRNKRVGELKNRKRAENKNKKSDLVRKRNERVGELKNRKSDLVRKRIERCDKENVNLMMEKLIGMELKLLLLLQVNAARHKLTTAAAMDFLNASSIKYALTINPTIYTSCIEQFWASVEAKTINGEVQLQALLDGKKVIITESTIRRDLQLEDVEGTDYLPNVAIFEQLTLMGYEKLSQKLTFYKAFFSPQWKFLIHTILQCLSAKTTVWNEFSSTMASEIICLATNQKFNFSKYIFASMVKNLDNAGKFLMYLRFVQVFLEQQVGDMSNHKRIYVTPSHTKKVFGNMKNVNKDFSGNVTPLFPTMVVQNQPQPPTITPTPTTSTPTTSTQTPIPDQLTTSIQPSQPQKQRIKKPTRKDTEELMEVYTNLQRRVLIVEETKTTQAAEIISLKKKVKKLQKGKNSRTHKLKRLYKVPSARVVSSQDEVVLAQRRNDDNIMFDVDDLAGDEVVVESEAASKDVNLNEDEVTLAQTLQKIKSTTPRAKWVVITEREQDITQRTMIYQQMSKDKGKAKMIEPEQPLKLSRK